MVADRVMLGDLAVGGVGGGARAFKCWVLQILFPKSRVGEGGSELEE